LYTRSKSECRSNLALRGKLPRLTKPDGSAVPFGASAHTIKSKIQIAVPKMKIKLFPETGLHGYTLAALGATARNNRLPALGFHTRPKAMGFRAVAPVRLECTLRHEK